MRQTYLLPLVYSPLLSNFWRVPTTIIGEVTFNTQRQRYEFIDRHGAEIDLSYVICYENHNKCYDFTDINTLKSAPLCTFLFDTKFILCKDRHWHIPKVGLINSIHV